MATSMCYRCMRNTIVDGKCIVCGEPVRLQREIGDEFLLPLGTHLDEGNIIIGDKLGSGGFGITYVALDVKEYGVVALKEFVPKHMIHSMRRGNAIYIDESDQEQYLKHMKFFREEAHTLSKLKHPNIVRVFFEFEENNTCYYGMELLKGRNLHEWIQKNGTLSAGEALQLIDPILNAMEYIHSKNVLHRDISPGNIYLRDAPGHFLDVDPCLIDFGAAYDARVAHSQSVPHVRSKGYSPPEQNSGRKYYGPFSDVYAISAVIYYLITGNTPPPSEERTLEGKVPVEPCVIRRDIPKGFSDALMHGLALDRTQRTQTASALRQELQDGLKSRPVKPPKVREPVEEKEPIEVWTDGRSNYEAKPIYKETRMSKDPRPMKGFIGSLLDTCLFAGAWIAVMSLETTRSIVDDNMWIAGLGVFIVAILVNLVTCLTLGGTLGECLTGYPQGRMEIDRAVFYALSGTVYPVALARKLSDVLTAGQAPPESIDPMTSANQSIIADSDSNTEHVKSNGSGPRLESAHPSDYRIRDRVYSLNPSGQVLGRWTNEKSTCDMPISDSRCVSRRHCRIYFDGRQWYIEDMGSKNGTFVNDKLIGQDKRTPLTEGTRITLGDEGIDLIFHEH